MTKDSLSATMEDYLKTIFTLESNKKYVRVRDIALKLNVRFPTVTSMLRNLAERNLVSHEKYEHVELTSEGKRIANEIYNRHTTLRKFLMEILRVDEITAEKDACEMEHAVSPVTLERLIVLMGFLEDCSHQRAEAEKNKEQYFDHIEPRLSCVDKMRSIDELR